MFKKQITNLAIVSVKFFLDIDPTFCAYTFLMAALVINQCRQLPAKPEEALYKGIHTVKQDFRHIKRYVHYAAIRLR